MLGIDDILGENVSTLEMVLGFIYGISLFTLVATPFAFSIWGASLSNTFSVPGTAQMASYALIGGTGAATLALITNDTFAPRSITDYPDELKKELDSQELLAAGVAFTIPVLAEFVPAVTDSLSGSKWAQAVVLSVAGAGFILVAYK